jgi:hypothetical protein
MGLYPLRGGFSTNDTRLDRLRPTDWEHVEKYPLTAEIAGTLKPTPVVLGVNWYSEFDNPTQDKSGHWWIARDGRLTTVRGGHCICLKPKGSEDRTDWYHYYDQGSEGRCVQFGVSRMMSHLNHHTYEIRENDPEGHWLYWEAQRTDEWPGGAYPGADPQYEGTSVRAALDIVKKQGLILKGQNQPDPVEGIKAYRWATSTDDVLTALGYGGLDYVDILNSWGTAYPHLVRMPASVVERLRKEDGEVGIPVDR